ncbi:MAG: TrmO family methyltransferase [Candidatus Thorarchaeota archaeon]
MNSEEKKYSIFPIGYVMRSNEEIFLHIKERFRPAMKQLDHFSHILILCWAHKQDNEKSRSILDTTPPYGENPPVTGIFATRAEYRPNPILLTTAKILHIDSKEGLIKINNIDVINDTPIIDLKAYFPVCDRVKDASIPEWLVDWPEWLPDEGLGL